MNPSTIRAILTTLLMLAIQGGHALANPIKFDFSSQLSSVPNSVAQINYGTLNFTPTPAAGNGGAWLDSAQGTQVDGSGSITVAKLSWQLGSSSSNPELSGTPSTYSSQSFGLALTLTDEASHAQGTLHFRGSFSGIVPDNGTLAFTPSTQTLHLGHNLYTVDLSHPVEPLEAGKQTFSFNYASASSWMLMGEFGGAIDVSAKVNVQPLSVQSAPEPASLALAGLGVATILGSGLRRRRRRNPGV